MQKFVLKIAFYGVSAIVSVVFPQIQVGICTESSLGIGGRFGYLGQGWIRTVNNVVQAGCDIVLSGVKIVIEIVGALVVRNNPGVGDILSQAVGIIKADREEYIFQPAVVPPVVRCKMGRVQEYVHPVWLAVGYIAYVVDICKRLEAVENHFRGGSAPLAGDEIQVLEFWRRWFAGEVCA